MIDINKIFRVILGFPKTIYVNFVTQPLSKAIRLPIVVSYTTNIKGLSRNSIIITDDVNLSFGIINIGINNGSDGLDNNKNCYLGCDGSSKIRFHGTMTMSPGGTLKSINGGVLDIGNNVSFNSNCKVLCKKNIVIGDDCLFGWDITISDADGHDIYDKSGQVLNQSKPVLIGDHVWIGAKATLLKGAEISSCSIIGYNTIVTKKYSSRNVVILGSPSRVVKEDVSWNI